MAINVLIAPDKFKGTAAAKSVAETIAVGLREEFGDQVAIRTLPLADGGEGTVDAILGAGGALHETLAPGPAGRVVSAKWASINGVAVQEVAATCGLVDITPSPWSSLSVDTYGVGLSLLAAAKAGFGEVILGIGGTAATDGGTGALRALGVQFLDSAGRPVPPGGRGLNEISRIDVTNLHPLAKDLVLKLACDVSVPLTGPTGAAQMFSPQKGAGPVEVADLERGLTHFAAVVADQLGVQLRDQEFGGAGGGIGAGLSAVLNVSFASGIALISETLNLPEQLAWADLVVTGEGSLDEQSQHGKTVSGVVSQARAAGVPVFCVVGQSSLSPVQHQEIGLAGVVSITELAGSSEAAMRDTVTWLRRAARPLGLHISEAVPRP